jgi:hypothetical protein
MVKSGVNAMAVTVTPVALVFIFRFITKSLKWLLKFKF